MESSIILKIKKYFVVILVGIVMPWVFITKVYADDLSLNIRNSTSQIEQFSIQRIKDDEAAVKTACDLSAQNQALTVAQAELDTPYPPGPPASADQDFQTASNALATANQSCQTAYNKMIGDKNTYMGTLNHQILKINTNASKQATLPGNRIIGVIPGNQIRNTGSSPVTIPVTIPGANINGAIPGAQLSGSLSNAILPGSQINKGQLNASANPMATVAIGQVQNVPVAAPPPPTVTTCATQHPQTASKTVSYAITTDNLNPANLVIFNDTPLDFDSYANLKEAFSESELPFKVDIVEWVVLDENFKNIIDNQIVMLNA